MNNIRFLKNKSDNDFIQVRIGQKKMLQQVLEGLRLKWSDNRELANDLKKLELLIDHLGR